MKKRFLFILVLIIGLTLIRTKKQEQTVVVYSSLEQFRNDELEEQLRNKFPEIEVRIMYIPTGKSAAKIALEGEKTEADIVVALETGYMDKIGDNLEDISGLSNIDYLEGFTPQDNGNKFVTWEMYAGSFIINTEVLEKNGLDIPKTYDDLLDSQYKNLIAMPDPKSSGTGYLFLKNRVNTLGKEEALEYFDKLGSNIKQYTESGSGPVKLLTQGEIGIGLGMTFQAVNQINEGRPFEIIFPPEGSPYSLSGTALIKGGKDNEKVMKVFDYIINDFLVYDKENFSPDKIYHNQKNLIEGYPENIIYGDMTGIADIEEKEDLLERWKY